MERGGAVGSGMLAESHTTATAAEHRAPDTAPQSDFGAAPLLSLIHISCGKVAPTPTKYESAGDKHCGLWARMVRFPENVAYSSFAVHPLLL